MIIWKRDAADGFTARRGDYVANVRQVDGMWRARINVFTQLSLAASERAYAGNMDDAIAWAEHWLMVRA
jgi:hypothetical protein